MWINVDGYVPRFLPFLALPPLFLPTSVPLVTSLGCAGSSDSGSDWCFFWCLLAWSPVFEGPRLRTGVWVRMWPLCEALSSAHVRGGIDWFWVVVVVVVGGGGSGRKEAMWQQLSHIWNVTGRGLRG
jgi:hypothetical protein